MSDGGIDLGVDGLGEAHEIGHGGFGTVYRAEQPEFGRTVAVKVLREPLTDPDVRRRFERECRAMGMLSGHPHIVTVYGGGLTATGRPYIVMDLMRAGSLADRVRQRGPLPWQEVCDLAVKLAGALATAHRMGVLHRDIKPENVLVSNFGEPKLGDFGIARVAGGTETKTSALTASVAHAAPELFEEGGQPSERSDLYALGSTMFALLAGGAAFVRDSDESLLPAVLRITNDPVPDLRPRAVPGPVCEVVERLMAKAPTDRFASAEELGQQLRRVQTDAGLPPTRMVVEEAASQPLGGETVRGAVSGPAAAAVPGHGGVPGHAGARPDDGRGGRRLAGLLGLAALVLVAAAGGAMALRSVARQDPGPNPAPPAPVPTQTTAATDAPSEVVPAPTQAAAPTAPGTATPVPAAPVPAPATAELLVPDDVIASSTAPPGKDRADNTITYDAVHTVDGEPDTAWRTVGAGIGETLQFRFQAPARVLRVGLIPGYDKIDPYSGEDRFIENRRVEKVRYHFDGDRFLDVLFQDQRALQFVDVDVVTQSVTVEILATTPHGGRDFTPISEVEIYGVPG